MSLAKIPPVAFFPTQYASLAVATACSNPCFKAAFAATPPHSWTGNRMLNLLKTSLIFLAALVLFGCSQSPTPANNTYSISGAVLNEVDNPLANIKVTLNNAATSATLATTLSDKDGNYSFTGLANGSYTVNADLIINAAVGNSRPPACVSWLRRSIWVVKCHEWKPLPRAAGCHWRWYAVSRPGRTSCHRRRCATRGECWCNHRFAAERILRPD